MIESFDNYESPSDEARIREGVERAVSRLKESHIRQDRAIVSKAEAAVAQNPATAFRFDLDGSAQLAVAGKVFTAGRFSCRPVGELLGQLSTPSEAAGKLRLFVLGGTSPVTDIGALQGSAPPDSMFQVASQFNCLEAPGPYLTSVERYFYDPTQGPRASISAFPGTLLRHYWAPGDDGKRFTQSEPSPQLDLLHRVTDPAWAEVVSGYLTSSNIKDPRRFAGVLSERFEEIKVGVHEDVEVVFGLNWDGAVQGRPLIGQVLTSTLAAGAYGQVDFADPTWSTICRQLQRAAYLGTVAAAAVTGQRRVVLTLIGGGVFSNPPSIIWESILYACDRIAPLLSQDLTVIVNGRELFGLDLDALSSAAQQRGGDLVLFHQGF